VARIGKLPIFATPAVAYGLTVSGWTIARSVAAAMWIVVVIAGPAAAAQAAVPNWSGLDVTHYDGPIPPQGGTLIPRGRTIRCVLG
jgi:hypothetical protein